MAPPYDALLHMIAAFRHLNPEQRKVWRNIGEYFAFGEHDPGAHLPDGSKGMLGPFSPSLISKMMAYIKASVQR